jgi:hypothetical protein
VRREQCRRDLAAGAAVDAAGVDEPIAGRVGIVTQVHSAIANDGSDACGVLLAKRARATVTR